MATKKTTPKTGTRKAPGSKRASGSKKASGSGSRSRSGPKTPRAPKALPQESGPSGSTPIGDLPETIREIVEIAARLNEAGLSALRDAAGALETKQKIENFNRELNVVADKAARRRREAATPDYRVVIERTQDDFFVIQLDDVRVFFNRGEMREIAGICQSTAGSRVSDPRIAGAKRLFKWFEKERSDLLVDAGINSERNPYLIDLYDVVVSTYTVKK